MSVCVCGSVGGRAIAFAPSQVIMIGDKRKYNVALVTLKAQGANGEVPGTDNLDAGAKRINPDITTISATPGWS